MPADKGNTTVVMDKADYDRQVRELLNDTSTYRKLPKDHTHSGIKDKQRAESTTYWQGNHGKAVQQTQTNRFPTPHDIWHTPKIHKESAPLFHALDHPPTSFPNT